MKYYCDGFLYGANPSDYGGGYSIVDEENNLIVRQEVLKVGLTNNEAEILGILNAMKYAKEGDQVSTDSMCCLSWVNMGKSKARADLSELLKECLALRDEKNINLMWESRNFNLAGVFNESRGAKWRRQTFDGIYFHREIPKQ